MFSGLIDIPIHENNPRQVGVQVGALVAFDAGANLRGGIRNPRVVHPTAKHTVTRNGKSYEESRRTEFSARAGFVDKYGGSVDELELSGEVCEVSLIDGVATATLPYGEWVGVVSEVGSDGDVLAMFEREAGGTLTPEFESYLRGHLRTAKYAFIDVIGTTNKICVSQIFQHRGEPSQGQDPDQLYDFILASDSPLEGLEPVDKNTGIVDSKVKQIAELIQPRTVLVRVDRLEVLPDLSSERRDAVSASLFTGLMRPLLHAVAHHDELRDHVTDELTAIAARAVANEVEAARSPAGNGRRWGRARLKGASRRSGGTVRERDEVTHGDLSDEPVDEARSESGAGDGDSGVPRGEDLNITTRFVVAVPGDKLEQIEPDKDQISTALQGSCFAGGRTFLPPKSQRLVVGEHGRTKVDAMAKEIAARAFTAKYNTARNEHAGDFPEIDEPMKNIEALMACADSKQGSAFVVVLAVSQQMARFLRIHAEAHGLADFQITQLLDGFRIATDPSSAHLNEWIAFLDAIENTNVADLEAIPTPKPVSVDAYEDLIKQCRADRAAYAKMERTNTELAGDWSLKRHSPIAAASGYSFVVRLIHNFLYDKFMDARVDINRATPASASR